MATLSETETSFAPLLYFPSRLSGLVDFFGELYSENPGRAQIMPDGKVEIAFFLGDSDVSEFYLDEDEEYDRGASFTTIGRFKAIAESLPAELADTASGRAFKTNPWFAFAATITSVHIGVLVSHGIVLLG